VQYEWDPGKAAANLKKHGVSFADAVTVFEDEFALTREDADADDEQRFVTLGAMQPALYWRSSIRTARSAAFV
jgi:uncharacterized DUF497 family protein